MLSPEVHIDGFDALAWARLLSLVTGKDPDQRGASEPRSKGMLVVIEDETGEALSLFDTRRGPLPARSYEGRALLPVLCREHGAARAVCLRQGSLERLLDHASDALDARGDYVSQWLTLARLAQELMDAGALYVWPQGTRRYRVPGERVWQGALDMLLPDDHVLLLVLWRGTELWTGAAIRRSQGRIDRVAGPDRLRAWTGPLGGDWRRDHLVMARAVAQSLGPVHLGIYAQATTFCSLLRAPDPGAWARAVAIRDVILHPTPGYVSLAVGADALRALAAQPPRWLQSMDWGTALAPLARYARSRVEQVASLGEILGALRLDQLGQWFRRTPPEAEPDPTSD